jgi:hypothetical protein
MTWVNSRYAYAVMLFASSFAILATGQTAAQAASPVPYQKDLTFSCPSCDAGIAAPGAGKQLTLNRISCDIGMSGAGAQLRFGYVVLRSFDGTALTTSYFAAASTTSDGWVAVNSDINVIARGGQRITVGMSLSNGTIATRSCSVAGTLGAIPP